MSFDVGFLLRTVDAIAEGLRMTIVLAVPALLLSAAWGVPLVMVLMSKSKLPSLLARSYVEVVRNTPVLVQMFFIYFGSGMAGFPLPGYVAGLLALVLQNGGYIAEIYRGGIQSISQRQTEAGLALGFMPRATFGLIVLPQAVRKVIPPLSNQGVLIIKDTSLVATISVAEMTFQARLMADRTAAVFEIFFVLALFYLALTTVFSLLMRLVEVRLRVRQ